MLKDKACIVGIGETPYCRKPGSGLSEMAIQLKAAVAAIEDAGLKEIGRASCRERVCCGV